MGFPLTVEVEHGTDHDEGFIFLKVGGELDICTKFLLDEHLEVIERATKGVVIDFQETTYMGAEGCHFLTRMWLRAMELGKHFRVKVKKNTLPHRVLVITKFHEITRIEYDNN